MYICLSLYFGGLDWFSFPDPPPHAQLALWFKPSCRQSALIWEKYWELNSTILHPHSAHRTLWPFDLSGARQCPVCQTSRLAFCFCACPTSQGALSQGQSSIRWTKRTAANGRNGGRRKRGKQSAQGIGSNDTTTEGNVKPLETMWEGEKEKVRQGAAKKKKSWGCDGDIAYLGFSCMCASNIKKSPQSSCVMIWTAVLR